MGLREWIILIAILIMAGIVFDAIRRLVRQRQSRGGSLRRRLSLRAGQMRGDRTRDRLPTPPTASQSAPPTHTEPEPPAAPDLAEHEGQRIPMLLDAVPPQTEEPEPTPRTDQFALNLPESAMGDTPLWPQWDEPLVIDGAPTPQPEITPVESPLTDGAADAQGAEPSLEEPSWDEPSWDEPTPDAQDAALSDQLLAEPEEVLVMTVLASAEHAFDGPSLLQLMLACGLRFGQMNIFHASDAQGALQYSVANAVKPGTFDLDALDAFTTRGVTFFLQLPCQAEPLEALSAMQHSATLLADTLGGSLLDDQRNLMTAQTLAHYHERVRAFQRAQLLPRS